MHMSKVIQLRKVSERLHRELMRRASKRSLTLSDYIKEILKREVSQPSREEVFERISSRKPVKLPVSAAELIREERRRRP